MSATGSDSLQDRGLPHAVVRGVVSDGASASLLSAQIEGIGVAVIVEGSARRVSPSGMSSESYPGLITAGIPILAALAVSSGPARNVRNKFHPFCPR
jgi:hypothetical protein